MGIIEIIVIACVVLLDIGTKVLAVQFMQEEISLIDGVFSFVYVENTGASFGMLKGQKWLFVVLTSISLVAFVFWLIKNPRAHKLARLSICLITAGAVGNLADRLYLGYVRDFIYFKLINFPVFNVADTALTIGIVLLIIYVLFIYKDPKKADASEDDNEVIKEELTDGGTDV